MSAAHPLVAMIAQRRAELAALETRKRRDRESEMRLSILLNGLETAARLCGFQDSAWTTLDAPMREGS